MLNRFLRHTSNFIPAAGGQGKQKGARRDWCFSETSLYPLRINEFVPQKKSPKQTSGLPEYWVERDRILPFFIADRNYQQTVC
jgi:hypothetical protein